MRLRNKFLKAKSCIDRKEHKKQCKYVVILLRKGKKNFYINFDISKVTDNRAFWKIVKPKISDKVKIPYNITLNNNNNNNNSSSKILSQDAEVAKTFNEFFYKYPNFKYAKQ